MFDMDGTFIDSRPFHARLFYEFFNKYRYSISYDTCYNTVGTTVKQLFRAAQIPEEDFDCFYRRLDEYYSREGASLVSMTTVADGFRELLYRLPLYGIKTAVVSNSLKCAVDKILSFHGLSGLLDDIVGADHDSLDKVRRCLKLQNKYQIEKEDILFVGDSESDMELANKMGYSACFSKTGISWYKDSEYIETVLKPAAVIQSFEELLAALEEKKQTDFIQSPVLRRRSCRKYTDRKITGEALECLCLSSLSAPSARGLASLELIAVTEREKLDAMSCIRPTWKALKGAAAAIIVAASENKYLQQNCSAATENILIAATELGIGSCWMGLYPNSDAVEEIIALLKLPNGVVPVSLISLGYPAERPEERTPDRSKIHYDEF